MSAQHQLRRWQGPLAVVATTLLLAVAVLLLARGQAGLEAQGEARAAVADAVEPVAETMREVLSEAGSGAVANAQQVSLEDSTTVGVALDVAARARDSGAPVLEDSGRGLVVVPTYDTASTPASVAERRAHATGVQVAALDLEPTLNRLLPTGGGISLTGADETIQSLPGPRPSDRPSYSVRLQPGPVQEWTLTAWTAAPSTPTWAWLTALGIVLGGLGAAGWLLRRHDRSTRNQVELRRLQETSATTTALATVAQHSLDLADLLPGLTTELATTLGLHGLSLSAPTSTGERQFFTWGEPPATVPPSSRLPHDLRSGQTLCLILARGGRTVARLRIVAGRDLDHHDLNALGGATDVLTSALANAEAFAQQRDLLQRMRSVDELKTVFLATASHELRTPVGAITGYAQILATSWDSLSSEEARTYAERIDGSAKRLAGLVEDLLDFSRLERGASLTTEASFLDLGETVTCILTEQPDLAPDHQLLHQTPPGFGVIGSQQAVERVVSNLVGNAAKYSPAGTVIRVLVKKSRARVELVVEDEGPGVPPSEREQVFSRFFRGTGDSVVATRGAGLGLAIVSEFAATMNGKVSVTAGQSGGARFIVSYPLVTASGSSVEGASDVRT